MILLATPWPGNEGWGELNEGSDGRREGWKEKKKKKRKGDWIYRCMSLPFSLISSSAFYFYLFIYFYYYFYQPRDFFFSFFLCPLLHILFSSISLRWRWLCLCICDIKSTAVPWLLARVNPAHSHLKIKWPYIYAAQIIGLSFGLVWWGNGQEIDSHRFA